MRRPAGDTWAIEPRYPEARAPEFTRDRCRSTRDPARSRALVPVTIPAGDVEATIRESGGALLQDVASFDLFVGSTRRTRSIAFRLHFRRRAHSTTRRPGGRSRSARTGTDPRSDAVPDRRSSPPEWDALVSPSGACSKPTTPATSYADRRVARAGVGAPVPPAAPDPLELSERVATLSARTAS